ncbi:phage antirepressor KilAC domain-containing protein [Zobellella sp. DQSA1]|uniref:phage antirepressor KilAC domain-containing protein n=1 Tax=Zobellella sp. DQSA1 TaxID=3342386 RepID=UPI0035BF51AA
MSNLMNRPNGGLTMSSREIAELVEKRHDNVRRAMDALGMKGLITVTQTEEPTPGGGKPVTVYHVNKRDSYVVVAQLSPEFTARLVDRWQELERHAAEGPKLPGTFAEALRLAAEQAERLEQQQAQLAQAAPKVEFVDRYVEASGLQNISNVAKMLNCGPIKFSRLLESDGILYRSGGALVPRQELIDRGLFRLKTGEANGHSWMQTKVTPKGVGWLSQRYGTEVDGL